jgi:hypothetical protein
MNLGECGMHGWASGIGAMAEVYVLKELRAERILHTPIAFKIGRHGGEVRVGPVNKHDEARDKHCDTNERG